MGVQWLEYAARNRNAGYRLGQRIGLPVAVVLHRLIGKAFKVCLKALSRGEKRHLLPLLSKLRPTCG